ncbi:glycosyl-4,4'-diaponeurosporenoate acyltransferase CrtO family protein [Lysobacter humi (ex Lee et al. 2017)]
MIARFKAWYFPPRPFESGRLYPLLGVRLFKKYLPTSGDLVSRRRRIKHIKVLESGGRQAALDRFQHQSQKWEFGHLVSAVLLQAWAVVGGLFVSPVQFWACTGINLVVNIYPVMLQRYNRVRMASLLSAGTRPNSSSKPTPLRGAA